MFSSWFSFDKLTTNAVTTMFWMCASNYIGTFGAKHPLSAMAFMHFTPNFERTRTFTFVIVHILKVRECAPRISKRTSEFPIINESCHTTRSLIISSNIVGQCWWFGVNFESR